MCLLWCHLRFALGLLRVLLELAPNAAILAIMEPTVVEHYVTTIRVLPRGFVAGEGEVPAA